MLRLFNIFKDYDYDYDWLKDIQNKDVVQKYFK